MQIDIDAAQRRAERIRFHATNANEAMQSLQKLVHQARELEDHVTLGYASWTAYVKDLFGDEPLRLARDVRRELVAELSDAGMSTRAIAPIVGVSNYTIAKDIEGVRNLTTDAGGPEDPPRPDEASVGLRPDEVAALMASGFVDSVDDLLVDTRTGDIVGPVITEQTVTEKVKTITGLDGKEYQRSEPKAARRRPITDQARDLGWDIRKQAEKLQRLFADDRFPRNKEEMTPHLRSHLEYVIRVCQDSLDHLNK